MTRISLLRLLFASALVVALADQASSVTVEIVALDDGDARGFEGFDTLSTDQELIETEMSGNRESRSIFEYDLGPLPNGAIITGVTFLGSFESISHLTQPDADFNLVAFTSDGVVSLSDATATGMAVGSVTVEETSADTDFFVGMSPAALQSVISDADPNDFFTLRGETENFAVLNVYSREAMQPGVTLPTLRINFLVIPEPSSAACAVSALAFLMPWCRRRRQ
jgi:hypothetical protein